MSSVTTLDRYPNEVDAMGTLIGSFVHALSSGLYTGNNTK